MSTLPNDWPKVRRENMVITPKVANMFQVNHEYHGQTIELVRL